MKLNSKAYTLSEFILIVILTVILGVLMLSAHKRRVATDQARAAEAFMRAVRYEQEDRCAAGRKYEVYAKNLRTFLKQKQGTKHVSYDLTSGMGMVARSKLYDFTLKMPSYADGRLCCDNCDKLNRRYSPCALLSRRKDFVQVDVECAFYPEKLSGTDTPTEKNTAKNEPEKSAVSPQAVPEEPQELPVASQEAAVPENTDEEIATQTGQPTPAVSAETNENTPSAEPENPQNTVPVQPENPADTQPSSSCQVPQKGNFFIEPCDTYEKGTQGAVLFTWNAQTCQYDVTQNCLIPARWKKEKTITREEKGVYPSDVDKLCSQLLASSGCQEQNPQGKECFDVDETCYSACKITDKKLLQESKTIVLYDVTLSVQSLRCQAAKNVTVTIP